MKNVTLNESRVVFVHDPHSYNLDGKELSGITSILARQLFPKKYYGVSEEVLKEAAERGSRIHEQCRVYDTLGFGSSSEVEAYKRIKDEFGIKTIANEYIVSDNENVASAIDLVAEDTEGIILADYKTTSHLDIEYLSWQLSIYKYLFELQNPHLKVKGLMGIWLPLSKYGKPRGEWIKEKPREEVIKLLEADAKGEQYTLPLSVIPPQAIALIEHCRSIQANLAELKAQSDALHEALYKAMEEYDVKKWDTDLFSVTRTLPTTQQRFDSTKFKSEHPEMYEQYKKTANVSGSVKITLKKSKQ